MAKTYSEKLRDPRWQKRRLEIMERDNWTCQECFSTTNTLNVHHLLYHRGVEPWEYADCYLLTICQDCHDKNHQQRPQIEEKIIRSLKFQLHDCFILNKFYELLEEHPLLPQLILVMGEIGTLESVSLLHKEFDKKRTKNPELITDPDNFECPACGCKKHKHYPKYNFIQCTLCGYSIYYAQNTDNKTTACS